MKFTMGEQAGHRLRKSAGILVVLLAVVAGVLAGPLITHNVFAAPDRAGDSTSHQIAIPAPVQLSSMFSQVSKEVAPAVVNINTESTVRMDSRMRRMPSDEQDPFGGLFGRFFDAPGQSQDFKQRSLGSGAIIDQDGYILTNNHVVSKADKIQVKLKDDPKSYDAKIVGTDSETDLAVIKIEANHPLPHARMGNSDSLNVGDWVLAIGSPFGLEETVTAGIISAKSRDLGSQFQRFLQTDAAINPGNSGGPLVNMAGEVVGINTAIASDNGNSAGVGFALPSNVAISVYNQIVKSGKVTRGSIGITFQPEQSSVLLKSFGATQGVVVTSVREDGPAAKAGLKQGDVIVSIDGKPIKDGEELVSKVSTQPVGAKVRIGYIRDRKTEETTVLIGDRGETFADLLPSSGDQNPSGKQNTKAKLGMSIENITPQTARQLGLKEAKGVLVAAVDSSSFAEEVGLQPGDVLLEMNQQPVRKVDDVLKLQENLKAGSDVVFLIERNHSGQPATLYLAGTLS